MPRVTPRPADTGASKLGTVQPIAADQEFSRLKTPDMSGGAVALQKFGAGIASGAEDFAMQMLADQKDDETISLLKTQEAGDEEMRAIKDEMKSLQGANAIGATAKATKRVTTFIDGLDDDEGMSSEGKIARMRYTNSLRKGLGDIETHERGEKQKYIVTMQNTAMVAAQERGVDYYYDDNEMSKQAGLIAQRAKDVAKMTTVAGSKGAALLADKLHKEGVSTMYSGAITRALAKDQPDRAEELLKQAQQGGFLDAASGELAKQEKAVSLATADEWGRDTANLAMASDPNDLERQLATARKIAKEAGVSPAKEAAAIKRIKDNYAENETIRKEEMREKKADAVGLAMAGNFDQIPKGVLAELGLFAGTLEKMSSDKRRGASVASDPAVYNRFNNMSPEDLKQNILSTDALTKLSESDWRKFSDRQSKSDPAQKTAQRSRSATVTQALKSAGVTSDTEVKGFNDALDDAILLHEQATGKKIKSEDIRRLTDLLLIDGEYKGTGFKDPDVKIFELKDGQTFIMDDYSDIPVEEITKIRAGTNTKLSQTQVLNIYNAALNAKIKKARGFK